MQVTMNEMFTGAIPQHTVTTTDKSFRALGLAEPILAALGEIGFQHPTPIQAAVIPLALAGRDVIGLAETGSGKTAAFALPLGAAAQHGRGVRGLILSPTREIALQTKAFLDSSAPATTCAPSAHRRRAAWARRSTTCARARTSSSPRRAGCSTTSSAATSKLDSVEELVLDEADHMLDMGFLPQMHRILEQLPARRQTMMFSATMPPPIERLAKRFIGPAVRDRHHARGTRAASGIEHRLYLVERDDKKRALLALLNQELGATLVFVRRKIDAEWLSRVLEREGHPVERIHSDLSQQQRIAALAAASARASTASWSPPTSRRAASTSRGSATSSTSTCPETVEDYVHRAGRTARGNAAGLVSTIATWTGPRAGPRHRADARSDRCRAAPPPASSPTSRSRKRRYAGDCADGLPAAPPAVPDRYARRDP